MRILTSYTKADFDRFYEQGYWKDETFSDALADAVTRTPEKCAIVHGDRQLTYRALQDCVRDVAAGLSAEFLFPRKRDEKSLAARALAGFDPTSLIRI